MDGKAGTVLAWVVGIAVGLCALGYLLTELQK